MAHRILLIEPGYKNKYPPLGLMKIAQYHQGKGDDVRFVKGMDKSVLFGGWSRVYVTTLFSFEWKEIARTIDFAIDAVRGQANNVFVGGIAASLMRERFIETKRWFGVRFISGLLDQAPAVSLQLDDFWEELHSGDTDGVPIESLVPDYSILDQVDYRYPVSDAYFVYASRGCIRECSFCGVPKIEGALRDGRPVSDTVRQVAERYGERRDIIFMDNNVTALPLPRLEALVDEVVGLGFQRGATISRGGVAIQRRVDFNQGVDARELAKNPAIMKQLARLCVSPLRIAFDNLALRGPYEVAIRQAAAEGLTNLSNYILYNFRDDPADLFERLLLNIELNEELGIRIFSFPMRYLPVDLPDRSHVGEHWTRYQLRSLQIALQATHGIVSGSPDFFRGVFGNTAGEFEELLQLPHRMIFNRAWFQQGGGQAELDGYQRAAAGLSAGDRKELLTLLSTTLFETAGRPKASAEDVRRLFADQANPALRRVLPFYLPLSREEEMAIWEKAKAWRSQRQPMLPADQAFEDAALNLAEEDDGGPPRLVA